MAQNSGPKPIGDAYAIVEMGKDIKDKWIRIGPVWRNRDGSETIQMEATPIEWASPRCERRIQIRHREERGRNRNRREQDDE